MKKTTLLLVSIIIGINFSVKGFSQNFTTENVKTYIGKTYQLHLLFGVVELTLDPGNIYNAKYESDGEYWYNSGKFKMEKGLIKLFPEVCKQFADTDEEVDCSSTLGEAKVDLIKDAYSLYYTEYLFVQSKYNKEILIDGIYSDHFLLPVPGKEVPAGTARKIGQEQIEVITMGMKKATTTSAVKIRKSPDMKAEEQPYYAEMHAPEQKSVPKNTSFTVIARTVEKTAIGKTEDYWYYIHVGANDGVWMYGEFVKFN